MATTKTKNGKAAKTKGTPETDKAAREYAMQLFADKAKREKAERAKANRPQQSMTDRFYLIPEWLYKKLRILVLADVAYEDSGEDMWDVLANDMHEGFDEADLTAVRFSRHDALTREKAYQLGFDSALTFA